MSSPVRRTFLIGEDKIGAIPGFNSKSNQGALPNWSLPSTTFDTTNYSGKFLVFWAVVWAEDATGNLLAEQERHGLKEKRSGMSFKQITDAPVEKYSNNVGMYDAYTPFFVAPKLSVSAAATNSPAGDTRLLRANDVLVEASPAGRNQRSWVTVTTHNTTGGDLHAEPVVFYDVTPRTAARHLIGNAFHLSHKMVPMLCAPSSYRKQAETTPSSCV